MSRCGPAYPRTPWPVSACRARVVLTGAWQDSWSGAATVAATEHAGPPSAYVGRHGETEMRLFSSGPGYTPTVQLDAGERAHGISPPDQGSIRPDGPGAQVRTTMIRTGAGGRDVHLDATFSC